MKFGDRNKLYCFSPPVMLLTFLLEFGLALYVMFKYKLNDVSRLVVTMLVALGVFQLSEYMVCGGLGVSGTDWARIGYVSITVLPALGIHLIVSLAGKKQPWLVYTAYTTAALFALYFMVNSDSVFNDSCQPNYAVFYMHGFLGTAYAIFYYGWLLVSALLAVNFAKQQPKKSKVMKWMLAGYAAFIVPTTIANLNDPATTAAIPSIMCGFAVLLALVLAFRVMPLSQKQSGHAKKR